LVGPHVAADDEKAIGQGTAAGDLEPRQQAFEDLAPGPCRGVELAKRIVLPSRQTPVVSLPGRIVADARHTDEEIDVAQELGEYPGRDGLQRPQLSRKRGETHLAARDVKKDGSLGPLVLLGRLDLELQAQVMPRENAAGKVVGVPGPLEVIAPAALGAEGGERVLPEDVRGEAIRIGFGLTLGIGQDIDLAMRLLERLPDLALFKPAAPGEHLLGWRIERMPEGDPGSGGHVPQRLVVGIEELPLRSHSETCLRSLSETPDEAPCHDSDQGMIEVPLAPRRQVPGGRGYIKLIDSIALIGKQREDFLLDLPQSGKLLGVLGAHGCGNGLLNLAVAPEPAQLRLVRTGDEDLGGEVAEGLSPHAHPTQAEPWNRDLLELGGSQAGAAGDLVESPLDLFADRAGLELEQQAAQLDDRGRVRRAAQDEQTGVADLDVPRSEVRDLLKARQGGIAQGWNQPRVGDRRRGPDEPSQQVRLLRIEQRSVGKRAGDRGGPGDWAGTGQADPAQGQGCLAGEIVHSLGAHEIAGPTQPSLRRGGGRGGLAMPQKLLPGGPSFGSPCELAEERVGPGVTGEDLDAGRLLAYLSVPERLELIAQGRHRRSERSGTDLG